MAAMTVWKWLAGLGAPQVECLPPSTDTLPALNGARAVSIPIRVEEKREDRPKFQREYTVRLDERAVMKITARTAYHGARYFSGELTQPNGRWVLFDPERVADKILDPTLVPLIERQSLEIKTMDRAFIASNPAEFIDEGGTMWRRVV